jgi:hypothetical protein
MSGRARSRGGKPKRRRKRQGLGDATQGLLKARQGQEVAIQGLGEAFLEILWNFFQIFKNKENFFKMLWKIFENFFENA